MKQGLDRHSAVKNTGWRGAARGAGAKARSQTSQLVLLKTRLLRQQIHSHSDPFLAGWLKAAAEEAASLAWLTQYPLLVFPALFEEKALEALSHAKRQWEILNQTQSGIALAV